MKQWVKTKLLQIRLHKKNVRFGKHAVIGLHSVFEGCSRIGADSLFQGKLGYGSYIGSNSAITGSVGRYCCIASGVRVVNGFHPINWVSMHPAFFSVNKQCGMTFVTENRFAETRQAEPGCSVVIGNDVWIGQNALIFAGLHIGDGAVIAAGAVVTEDVAPYTIVGGVPAKRIRQRFECETAKELQKIAWWDWPVEKLRDNASDFTDTAEFVRKWKTDGASK